MAAVQSDCRPFSLPPLERVLTLTISSPFPGSFKAAPTGAAQLRPYKSPYSLLSTYGIQSIPSQGRMKAPVKIRGAVESSSMETASSSARGAPVGNDDFSAHAPIDQFSDNLASNFKRCDQVYSIENADAPEPTYNLDSLRLLSDGVCIVGGSGFDLKPADAENAEQGCSWWSSTPRLAPANANNVGAANIGTVACQRMAEDIHQQEVSASCHSNGDDGPSFIDIDELLSGRGEGILATVEPTSFGMAETGNNGTRGGSPVSCSRLTVGSTQGSVRLSDEPMVTESDTDYGEDDLGPTAKGGSGSLHVADSVNSLGLNVVEEVEDRECGDFNTGSDKHQNNSVIESGISAHGGCCNHPQPLQLDPAAAHQQPDPTSKPLPAARRAQKSAPRYARRKHPRSSTSAGLTTTASTASTVTKSTNFEIRLPHASAADSGQGRQLCVTEDESTDQNDEDFANDSDTSSNASERPPLSKRMRRSVNPSSAAHHEPGKCSFEISNQDVLAGPATDALESDEIPIRGILTLRTVKSKLIYCLSFSQELSPHPGETRVSKSGDREDSEQTPRQEQTIRRPGRHSKYSVEDDELLRHLKEDKSLSWDEIAKQFPGRSKETLQVRYCTTLKRRPGTTQKAKKRRRLD